MKQATDLIIVIKNEDEIVTHKESRYGENPTVDFLKRLGYKEVIVNIPKVRYKLLYHRVSFMYDSESHEAALAVIRSFMSKWNGEMVNHKFLVQKEMKIYPSVPDHYHSGLGHLFLVESPE